MKKTIKTIAIIAAAAMTLAGCKKNEVLTPAGDTVKVSFSASFAEISKVTLEADQADEVFTPGWVIGDQVSLTYSGPYSGNVTATWNGSEFTAEVSQEVAEAVGNWSYTASYGTALAESFTQEGDAFNGAYDMMTGTVSVSGEKFLQEGGAGIVFPMVRETGILYFHLNGGRSAIAEPITAATLKYGENTVNVTVNNGTALNEADGHQFWFCLPEGNYSSIQFSAETENYKFEVNTKDGQTLSIAKGKLAKIVGTVSATNYSYKGEQPSFGPGVFDSCDYSPFVVGNSAAYVADLASHGISLCEGKVGKAYGFTTTIEENVMIGPMYITRGTPLATPEGITEQNGMISFYVYTDKVIDLAPSAGRQCIVEITTSGQADKEEYQWMLWEGGNGSTALKSLPVGWTKLELNLADAQKTGTPNLTKGFNFFRIYPQGNNVAGTYNIKVDEIKLEKKTNYDANGIAAFTSYPKDQNGNAVSGLQFKNTHPVFSADKKTAYVSSTIGHIVAIDLEEGAVKWVYTPSATSGCKTICVNPINGDVIAHNNNGLISAIKPDGTKHWEKSGFKPYGSSFAINSTGSVIFVPGGNNRQILAIDANTGSTLFELNQTNGGSNFYTAVAQIVVFDEDDNYDYIANQGNEMASVIRHNKSTHEMEVLNWVKVQSKKTDTSGGVQNHAVLDITSAAVSPDKKFVYFLGGSVSLTYCEIFAIDVTNAKTATSVQTGSTRLPIKYNIVQKTVQKAVSGLVFDKNGNAYLTAAKYVKKVAEADLRKGGEITAAWTSTVSGADDNSFNFMCPAVAESGKVYFSCVKGTPGAVYMANSSANATKVCDPGVAGTNYQGVFAMTDGYAVLGSAAGLYVKKLDETIAPNTWGYFGGDPCGSKNANFVYGNN